MIVDYNIILIESQLNFEISNHLFKRLYFYKMQATSFLVKNIFKLWLNMK